ncbi:unnamed protein product [Pleuronectes platessa]|uniref:Uncharacterized protein n=1 Tax=Pleuronectes platessa TaxID=8262 RepID=A0A9N7VHC8_PLEPL|nr:unnamed protein product [Pleuronectes platessa]
MLALADQSQPSAIRGELHEKLSEEPRRGTERAFHVGKLHPIPAVTEHQSGTKPHRPHPVNYRPGTRGPGQLSLMFSYTTTKHPTTSNPHPPAHVYTHTMTPLLPPEWLPSALPGAVPQVAARPPCIPV